MEQIINSSYQKDVLEWLEAFINALTSQKEILLQQINSAKITRENLPFSRFLSFAIDKSCPAYPHQVRMPCEIRVFSPNRAPIQILFHFKEGYLREIEVFRADSSVLEPVVSLHGKKTEIIMDEALKGKKDL